MYAHVTCERCGVQMFAVGDTDGPGGIGGYEDAQGNGVHACAGCTDSQICRACAEHNPYCPACAPAVAV